MTQPEIITLRWTVDDVQNLRPDLNEQEARAVIRAAAFAPDFCQKGISVEVLLSYAQKMFPSCGQSNNTANNQRSNG